MHTFAPNAAVNLEFEWLDAKFIRWIEIAHYWNRITKMKDDRWPHIVYRWDMSLKCEGWFNQLQQVLTYANIDCDFAEFQQVDLDVLGSRLLRLNKNKWLLEVETKTKLRTFLKIYDAEEPKTLVKANLTHRQWSLTAKLKIGILPLELEIG